jgi:DNA repair protein RecN (Recombination protein N)
MLEELRITNLGVIDSSTLDLGPGLTVISGETGAGKTMVVTALGLLLGGRSDAGSVRSGAARARVEGIVTTRHEGLRDAVDEVGGQIDDDQVVLARQVAAEGRSRAWVGGASVPVSTLSRIAEPMVAVHGQSDQHRLLLPAAQRQALDDFAGVQVLADEYAATWNELMETLHTLQQVRSSVRERAREADQLRFGLEEIEKVDPRPGEDAELAAEEARLGFADTLRTAAETAREALSSEAGDPDALAASAVAHKALESVRSHDPEAAALADRLAEVTYLLGDLAGDVASYAAGLDVDPARLAGVSERRAAITQLTRKYGESVDEVLVWAEAAAKRLLDLDGTDEQLSVLEVRRDELHTTLGDLAAQLSERRSEAASELGEAITAELTTLAMPHARVEVSVTQQEVDDEEDAASALLVSGRRLLASSTGVDSVELLLAANVGSEPRALAKGASGGELSRVMLALEVTLAGSGTVPTMVFDEVDAGVGGKAAIEVGRRLARLARSAQVLVVTHLPQVAAYADTHVVVEKDTDGSVTSSGLTTLDQDGRERELARMLAGLEDSGSARAHARELLDAAAPERACLHETASAG